MKTDSIPLFFDKDSPGKGSATRFHFIETYDITREAVYRKREPWRIGRGCGIAVASIRLFDFMIGHLLGRTSWRIFSTPKSVSKATLLEEMAKMLSVETVVVPGIARLFRKKAILSCHQGTVNNLSHIYRGALTQFPFMPRLSGSRFLL